MPTDAQTTTTPGATAPAATVPTDPRERALAALDRLGWDGGGEGDQDTEPGAASAEPKPDPKADEAPDELAEIAAKIEAKLKGKEKPQAAAPAPAFDTAAYKSNPIAYLEQLGLDAVELGDILFDYASLKPEERQARANAAELERLRQAEKTRKEQDAAAAEEQQIAAAEQSYLAHLESAKARYPHLMALEPQERLRYSSEVAQMIVDAGEDANPLRLARLTEQHVARLAKNPPGAGAGDHKKAAVVGDRTGGSAAGGAPQTITNHLAAESGSPAERDLSPDGRRAAALRKAASLGW